MDISGKPGMDRAGENTAQAMSRSHEASEKSLPGLKLATDEGNGNFRREHFELFHPYHIYID